MKKVFSILLAVMVASASPAFALGKKPNQYSTCLAAAYSEGNDPAIVPPKVQECARLYVDCTKMVTVKKKLAGGGTATLTTCKQI